MSPRPIRRRSFLVRSGQTLTAAALGAAASSLPATLASASPARGRQFTKVYGEQLLVQTCGLVAAVDLARNEMVIRYRRDVFSPIRIRYNAHTWVYKDGPSSAEKLKVGDLVAVAGRFVDSIFLASRITPIYEPLNTRLQGISGSSDLRTDRGVIHDPRGLAANRAIGLPLRGMVRRRPDNALVLATID